MENAYIIDLAMKQTKWLLRLYMHWNKNDIGILISFSSLKWRLDIIFLPSYTINSLSEDIGIGKVIEHKKAFWCPLFIIFAFLLSTLRHVSQFYYFTTILSLISIFFLIIVVTFAICVTLQFSNKFIRKFLTHNGSSYMRKYYHG